MNNKIINKKYIKRALPFLVMVGVIAINTHSVKGGTASYVGAKSETNEESGDVFLGGNYIEVGLSKGGSFGTSASASSDFHVKSDIAQLGLLSDGDGFEVGEESNTGDFFLPGTPEERYIVGYTIDTTVFNYNQADRQNVAWSDPIQEPITVDESNLSLGLLQAKTTGITTENLEMETVVSFHEDNKYYLTQVTLTNNSDLLMKDVRYVRSFDPDQDRSRYNLYDTYNKVISNPLTDYTGEETQYAMVVARGKKSLEGVFFLAFDERARASTSVEFSPSNVYLSGLWTDNESLPVFSTEADLELTADMITEENLNNYALVDNAIAITFDVGDLEAGESTVLEYYTSLDPNVIESLSTIQESRIVEETPDAIVNYTTKEITGLKSGDTYQLIVDGVTIEFIADSTGTYDISDLLGSSIQLVKKGGEESDDSEAQTIEIKDKLSTPSKIEFDITNQTTSDGTGSISGITSEYEYSTDFGVTWTTGDGTISDIEGGSVVYIRLKATESSPESSIRALVMGTSEDSDGSVIKKVVSGEDVPSVSWGMNLDNLKLAVLSEEDESRIDAGEAVEIQLKVDNITEIVSNEDKMLIEGLLEKDQVGVYFDISLLKYIGEDAAQYVTTTEGMITVTIAIPTELLPAENESRTYKIIRIHDGVATEISDLDEEPLTFTFETNQFSVYAMTYNVTDTSPQDVVTGERFTGYYVLLFILSSATLCLLFIKGKQKKYN